MSPRRVLCSVIAVGAVAMMWVATAWACANLATLNLSSAAGQPGDTITIHGSSFGAVRGGASGSPGGGGPSSPSGPGAGNQPVVVHWNSPSGPVLATVTPDATGNIAATVRVPQAPPGSYVFVATQSNGNGADVYGTPSRATFTIQPPPPVAAPTPAAPGAGSVVAPPSTSHGIVAVTIVLGVAGLALFGMGAGAFFRHARRRAIPSREPITKR